MKTQLEVDKIISLARFIDYAHIIYFTIIFGHYIPNNGLYLWAKLEPQKNCIESWS